MYKWERKKKFKTPESLLFTWDRNKGTLDFFDGIIFSDGII